jgi:hypothetical protein
MLQAPLTRLYGHGNHQYLHAGTGISLSFCKFFFQRKSPANDRSLEKLVAKGVPASKVPLIDTIWN